MIDLSIVIVNYNVKEFLQNLVESINKASKNITTEIIVVDNNSDDGSTEIIQEKYPFVNLIKNKENVGFGRANNIGLKISRGKYILMINPDTIVREDTFDKMIDFFEANKDVGLAGCKVLNPDGTLQLACRRGFPGVWTSFTKVTGLSTLFPKSNFFAKYNLTYLDENQSYEVDAISGAFMFMRSEVYESVDGFDPQFFMYGEDLDLCYRVQKAGYKVYYVHSTEIIHYKGESTKRSSIDETQIFYDAMNLFVKKHFSTYYLVEFILRFAIVVRKLITFLNVYKIIIGSILLDFTLFVVAVLIAENIYLVSNYHGFPESVKPMIYLFPAVIQVIISGLSGAYSKNTIASLKSIGGLLFGFLFITSLTFFFKQFAFSRAVILIAYFLALIFYSAWRIIIKFFFKVGIAIGKRNERTLIVGTSKASIDLADKIKNSIEEISNVVGLITKSKKEINKSYNGYRVIGSYDIIGKVIDEEKIDKLILSSTDLSFNEIFTIVAQCQGKNIELKVAGSNQEFLVSKSAVTMLDDIPLVDINYNISSASYMFSKLILDYLIAIPSIIFIFPFVILFYKITGKSSDFINLIMQLPEVLLRKKSLVGPKTGNKSLNLYLGKPGLTGLWYIEKYDNRHKDLSKLDIYYAKNSNVWLDLEIIGETLSKMLINKEK
jgi:hypothetical protein